MKFNIFEHIKWKIGNPELNREISSLIKQYKEQLLQGNLTEIKCDQETGGSQDLITR